MRSSATAGGPGAGRRRLAALAISCAAAALFLAAGNLRLDAQGAYYDEVEQAAASFAILGSPPAMFCAATIAGVPVLNVSYQGAQKSILYGLYLRLTGRGFSLASWRRLGLALAAAGIVGFALLAAPSLAPCQLAAFSLLVATDVSLLLGSRHDYGPVAMALLLRLLFLGAWLARPAGAPRAPANSFVLALLVGQAIHEKLHAFVLLLPLALIVLGEPERRHPRHRLAALAGLAAGMLPLAVVNLVSLAARGELVSLHGVQFGAAHSLVGLTRVVAASLSLGAGHQYRRLILGDAWPLWATLPELLLAAGLLAWTAWRARALRGTPLGRRLAVLVASAVAFPCLLYALPRVIWVHHWLVGTPLLALAVVMALGPGGSGRSHPEPGAAVAHGAVGAWLGVRAVLLGTAVASLAAGHASHRWDPSLTRFAAFTATRRERVLVVGADWGVAVQAHCFADGAPGFAFEPFWTADWQADLERVREAAGSREVYVARLRPPFDYHPERTRAILDAFADHARWRAQPLEPELASLAAVEVRKYSPRLGAPFPEPTEGTAERSGDE